jgi:4-amino-4-deoxy-L-arabinose transferase-like glycosyltransferase
MDRRLKPSPQPLPPTRAALGPGTLRDCTTIVVAALLVAVVLRPFQGTPFIDDWVYSWPVQHLLDSHEFLFPELVGNPIAAQVLWGALFCLPFGFSLSALRVSTWVLGVLAVCALYLLVRESGGTRSSALMAAAVLAFYPVFFILSPTFMTDVPFLAAMLLSALLFVRALHRRRVALVWLAAAVCAASVGSRIIGVGVAGAMITTLLFHTGRWGRRIHVLLPPALIGPFTVWLFVWTRARVFSSADITWLPNGPQQRLANIRYAFSADILPSMLVETLLFALVLVGIALLPIAVGLVRRAIVRRTACVLVVFAAAWIIAKRAGLAAWVPFKPGGIWAFREIGATASFVPGWHADPLPRWAAASAVTVALASAAILVAAWPRGAPREAEKFLLWNIAVQTLLVAVLWLTADRYALVFVPLTAALVLARRPPQRSGPTVACIVAYAAITLAGAHDHLDYNRAVWSAVADLRAGGVPPRDIDGGYVVNGWLQYLHPDDAYHDASGRIIVPMVNDFAELTYRVAEQPMPNRAVVRTYRYIGWLRPGGYIYVLKR